MVLMQLQGVVYFCCTSSGNNELLQMSIVYLSNIVNKPIKSNWKVKNVPNMRCHWTFSIYQY